MINHTLKTLGELLTHKNHGIYRTAMSLLRQLQALNPQDEVDDIRYCHLCGSKEENKFCTNTTCYEYTRYETNN